MMSSSSSFARTPGSQSSRTLLLWLPVPVFLLATVGFAAAGINTATFLAWNGWAQAWPPVLWTTLSILGDGSVLFALFVWTVALRPRLVAAFLLLLIVGGLASHGLKTFFQEARPAAVLAADQIHVLGQVLKGNNSFPSGHSLTAFSVAAVVAASARANLRWRMLTVVTLVVAVGVAFSRVAVGAHWPLDLLFGAAVGWACGLLSVLWLRRLRFWRKVWFRRAMAVLIGVAAALLFTQDLGYPQASALRLVAAILGVTVSAWIAWSPRRASRQMRRWLRAAHT